MCVFVYLLNPRTISGKRLSFMCRKIMRLTVQLRHLDRHLIDTIVANTHNPLKCGGHLDVSFAMEFRMILKLDNSQL